MHIGHITFVYSFTFSDYYHHMDKKRFAIFPMRNETTTVHNHFTECRVAYRVTGNNLLASRILRSFPLHVSRRLSSDRGRASNRVPAMVDRSLIALNGAQRWRKCCEPLGGTAVTQHSNSHWAGQERGTDTASSIPAPARVATFSDDACPTPSALSPHPADR